MTRKAVRRLCVVIDINVAFTGFSSASPQSPPREIIQAWLHAGLLDLIAYLRLIGGTAKLRPR